MFVSIPVRDKVTCDNLPVVQLLAWADVVGHGGRPRRWLGLEIHVGQHRGQDGRRTSERRLREGIRKIHSLYSSFLI